LRVMVILNPKAGAGKAGAQERLVANTLRSLGVDFDMQRTGGPGDAMGMARAAADAGYDVVAAVGGDGTVNEVVNGIAHTGAALATIPCGTGNDFCRSVGIPIGDTEAACAVIARGRIRDVDLCRVNDRYFISCFGTGFDAAVTRLTNARSKWLRGKWNYILSVMQVILTYRAVPVTITMDGKVLDRTPLLCACMNARTYGGGMLITPDAKLDDGLFDVCLVDNTSMFRFLQCFGKVMDGSHVHLKEVEMYKASHIVFECSSPQAWHVEGEAFTSDRMELTIEPRAVKVITGGE